MVGGDPAYKVSENLYPYIAIGNMEVFILSSFSVNLGSDFVRHFLLVQYSRFSLVEALLELSRTWCK